MYVHNVNTWYEYTCSKYLVLEYLTKLCDICIHDIRGMGILVENTWYLGIHGVCTQYEYMYLYTVGIRGI